MSELRDRYAIQCNYREATRVAVAGARAYLVCGNPGNGHDRVFVKVRSRGNRFVTKWEATGRLIDFRVKTIPPEHPLYADTWEGDSDRQAQLEQLAVDLNQAAAREYERIQGAVK